VSDLRLLGARDIRGLATRYGVIPTKQRGQNFVIDANTVRMIVARAGVGADDVVAEVGPGLGSLTLALLDTCAHVTAIEIDEVLAAGLPQTVAERAPQLAGKLAVVAADALSVKHLPAPEPTAMVSNLPYNVAVPVVLHFLAAFPSIATILVMVQAEVADRLAAGPGSRTYGVPSAKVRWYGSVERVGSIGRNVFWPAPNVDSALVLIRREPREWGVARDRVFTLIDAGFAQRRKTLRAALAGVLGGSAAAESALKAAGIDPQARAETLGIDAWVRLAASAG
jgi:16S rRNA (adenine1518-N6/adenine1519-N6)-dimethyltransferase